MLPQSARPSLFLATTSLLPFRASADANWLFPAYVPNAPPITFESQDTIDAAWTSAYVAPVLVLFCQTNNDGGFSIDFQSPAPVLPNGSYSIPLDAVQNDNQHCHLNLNETNGPLMGTGNSSNSGNFLVDVQSDRSATTWSTSVAASTASSSTTTSTPTTTPAASPTRAATATSQSSTTHQSSTGLSSGAKAGIGVGVALGVLALVLAGLLLWRRAARRRRSRSRIAPPDAGSQNKGYGGTFVASEVPAGHHDDTPAEMDGGNRHEEKDGFPIARRMTAGELEADPAR